MINASVRKRLNNLMTRITNLNQTHMGQRIYRMELKRDYVHVECTAVTPTLNQINVSRLITYSELESMMSDHQCGACLASISRDIGLELGE